MMNSVRSTATEILLGRARGSRGAFVRVGWPARARGPARHFLPRAAVRAGALRAAVLAAGLAFFADVSRAGLAVWFALARFAAARFAGASPFLQFLRGAPVLWRTRRGCSEPEIEHA